MRIFISGCPKTGKTTLATTLADCLGVVAIHSDQFVRLPWEDQLAELYRQVLATPDCVVEGTLVARLLPRPGKPSITPDLLIWTRGSPAHESHKPWRGMTAWVLKFCRSFQSDFPSRTIEVALTQETQL